MTSDDAPWLSRPEWASRMIRTSGSLGASIFAWVFAIFWNGFLLLALFIAVFRGPMPDEGRIVLLVVFLLFGAAGAFLLWMAIGVSRNAMRFRGAALRLDTLPGVIGGNLRGALLIPEKAGLDKRCSVSLNCWRRYRSTDSTDDLLWETFDSSAGSSMHRVASGMEIPFHFLIPIEKLPTTLECDPRIAWEVALYPAGREHGVSFEVPVFKTAASRMAQTERESFSV